MADPNMTLALRIQADLKQAEQAVGGLGQQLDQAGQQAQQTNVQLGATSAAVDKLAAGSAAAAASANAVGAGLDQVTAAEQRSTQAAAAMVAALQDQVALFGKSQDEVLRYRAAQLGAADAVEPLIKQLTELRTAQQQAAAAAQAEEQAQRQAATAVQAADSQRTAFLASLQEQADLQGKSRLEMLEYRAAQLGVTSEAASYIARLRETGEAQGRAGLTAGQYSQALRMLPMQLTDVATSLASGMPLWMVAIQQGGQIRDSFGGIGNAARAVMGALSPLAVAISAVVAGGAALLLAFHQGQQEASAYHQALILTGNAAGTSADQLAGMAQRMDAVSGTQRQAAAALAEIAGTGKFAATQIEAIGTAAVAMENATGRAVSDTVAEFERLAEEPAAASAKLNQQYNYITAAVYQQIRALEQQGDAQGAAQLAIEAYADAMRERAAQVTENLGHLERAWRAVSGAAAEAWDAMLDIGRADTLEEKLAGAYQELERLQKFTRNAAGGIGERRLQEAQAEIERLQQQIQERDAKALEGSQQAAINQAGIEAVQQLDKAVNSTASNAEKLKVRLKEIDDQAVAAARAGMPYDAEKIAQLKAAAAEQYTEPAGAGQQYLANLQRQVDLHGKTSEAAKVRYQIERGLLGELSDEQKKALILSAEELDAKNAAADAAREAEATTKQQTKQTEQLARQQESYVAGLERQAATIGMTADQVRAYELAEKGLTGALNERARAALAVIEASERQRQADANVATNAGLEADYLRAIGNDGAAAMLEISARIAQMQKEFQALGNDAGLALIDKLIPVEQARVRLDVLQAEIDKAFASQDRGEQSIDAQVNAGLLTESEGRARLLDLHRQTADVIEQYLPELQQMAQLPGPMGEQAKASLDNVRNKVLELRSASTDLELAMKNGLTSGIDSALQGLADGTLGLRDAISNLIHGVADSMAQLASQQLAQSATQGIMGLFGGGQQNSDMATGAAAVTGSAGALSMAGGTLLTGAAAIQAAAASLAAANGMAGMAGAGGAAGAAGGSGAGGWLSAAASLAGTLFASTGGHVTGPGTTTSDSIPAMLSNWEYVTRAAVVQQPGALGFLHDFNARGMAALDDWATRVRHSTGGLAGVPAPSLPAPSLGSAQLAEPAKALGATVQNAINLYAVQDESQIAGMAWGKAGQQHFAVYLQRNAQTVRSILKI